MMTALARPRNVAALIELLGAAPSDVVDAATAIGGLADDSRDVAAGDVFFARRGTLADGGAFAKDALARGAVAVVSRDDIAGVPVLRVSDVDDALRKAADAWYGCPQDALGLIGITGTKGKTTTAHLVAGGLRACGIKAAVIGTIAYELGDGEPIASRNTTPGVLALRRLLARARDAGCTAAVMEVSSHALDQARVAGLSFQTGVFTNLASDHLDYHRTPEAYFEAKAKLFAGLVPTATAVLNREDPAWRELASRCEGAVLTYGEAPEADLRADAVALTTEGTTFRFVVAGDGQSELASALVGRHNVLNMLAAIGACAGLGHDPIVAAQGVVSVDLVPGRLQRVEGPEDARDIDVFVDYAHTEDSLRQALGFLRDAGAAAVGCVIGCGGGRDRTKRPLMARAAVELADHVVFTSDNPRTEDPDAILDEMTEGLAAADGASVRRIVDRREAIHEAILSAPPGTTLLVAGKGHETYQIIGTQRLPFDDVEEVRRALERRAASSSEGNEVRGDSPA